MESREVKEKKTSRTLGSDSEKGIQVGQNNASSYRRLNKKPEGNLGRSSTYYERKMATRFQSLAQ